MKQRERKSLKCSAKKLCTMGTSILLTIILLLTVVPLGVSGATDNLTAESTSSAQLQSQLSDSGKYTVQQVANELFGDVNISRIHYSFWMAQTQRRY